MVYQRCMKSHTTTLKETSAYKQGNTKYYMTESDLLVKNFDKVVGTYCRAKRIDKVKSNDALLYNIDSIDENSIITETKFLFVEFKSGNINQKECDSIHSKLCCSCDMLKNIIEEVDDIYLRNYVDYILVYDLSKQSCKDTRKQLSQEEIQYSNARTYIAEQLNCLANGKQFEYDKFTAGFGLEQYRGNKLHDVMTMEKDRFNWCLDYITAKYIN